MQRPFICKRGRKSYKNIMSRKISEKLDYFIKKKSFQRREIWRGILSKIKSYFYWKMN